MRRSAFPARLGVIITALLLLAACTPSAQPSPTVAPAQPAATAAAAQPAPATTPARPAPESATAPARSAASPAAKASFDEQAVADFYRDKTVRIIVGTAAGGGYDTYSRVIAKHLSRYIPGGPQVIVENMPGAGTVIAANHVYNVAPKDGTVIGNIFGTLALEQLLASPGIEFDLGRFQKIAVPVAESYLFIVTKDTGVTKLDDLLGPSGKEIVAGGIPGSTVEHAPLLLHETLGANVKVVSGYTGTSKVRLAMENGEVDSFFNTWQSIKITNKEQIDNGDWRILLQLNDQAIPELPGQVPTIPDVASTEEQRQLLLFGTSYPNQFGKLYVTAAEVPADRVTALQQAFLKTMADKEFLADAEQSKLEISPVAPPRIEDLVKQTLSMPAGVKDKLKRILKPA